MSLQDVLESCRSIGRGELADAPDQILAFLSTWDGHDLADAAYEVIQQRNRALRKPPFRPWREEVKSWGKPKTGRR